MNLFWTLMINCLALLRHELAIVGVGGTYRKEDMVAFSSFTVSADMEAGD